jgi:hypothetical protein
MKTMKEEDKWMVAIVSFTVIWTLAFGWGIFG